MLLKRSPKIITFITGKPPKSKHWLVLNLKINSQSHEHVAISIQKKTNSYDMFLFGNPTRLLHATPGWSDENPLGGTRAKTIHCQLRNSTTHNVGGALLMRCITTVDREVPFTLLLGSCRVRPFKIQVIKVYRTRLGGSGLQKMRIENFSNHRATSSSSIHDNHTTADSHDTTSKGDRPGR